MKELDATWIETGSLPKDGSLIEILAGAPHCRAMRVRFIRSDERYVGGFVEENGAGGLTVSIRPIAWRPIAA